MKYSHQNSVYTFIRYSRNRRIRRRSTAASLPPPFCRAAAGLRSRTKRGQQRPLAANITVELFFCESLLATGVQLDRYNDSKPKPRSRQKVRKSVGAHKVTERKCFASDTAKIHKGKKFKKQYSTMVVINFLTYICKFFLLVLLTRQSD